MQLLTSKQTIQTDQSSFHSELHKVRGRYHLRQLNSLAFLCSALSPVRSAEQLFVDSDIESCDWTHVFALASNRLVAPLLFARLQQKQLANYCPDDFIAALEAFHQANCKRNIRHREILFEAITLLNQVDITPKLLKGSHALVGKMPDYNERVIGDIDLLIPMEQVKTAQTILLSAGFYHEKTIHMIDELDEDDRYHQLKPLFHPSGSGYIELHRFPHHSEHYPAIVPNFFMPEKMLRADKEGCRFYYSHPWQLLFYNQVHHYHSNIATKGLLDIRHLAEQSALVNEIDDLSFLRKSLGTVFPTKTSMSCLQFKLLATLFGHDLPTSMFVMNPKEHKHYQETLSILLNARAPFYKRNLILLTTLISQMIKSGRLKRRIFSVKWYRSIPELLRKKFQLTQKMQ